MDDRIFIGDRNCVTIDDRLYDATRFGAFGITLRLWGQTAKRLRKQGFIVTEAKVQDKQNRKGEKTYDISWAHAEVTNLPDVWDPDVIVKIKNGLSQSQYLWLHSKKSQLEKNKK